MIASGLKQFAVQLSKTRFYDAVVDRMEQRTLRQPLLRVLMYHRIDDHRADDPYYPGLISASPEQFVRQMELLADRYHVCCMGEVVAAKEGRHVLPANSVLVTFDDATSDFASQAWPVMKSLKLPVTVFVPTAYPGNSSRHFWWDRLHRGIMHSADGTVIPSARHGSVRLDTPRQRRQVFRRLKEHLKSIPHSEFRILLDHITSAAGVSDPEHNNVLNWPELRTLASEGVTLAPHTHTHPMLNQLAADEVANEVRLSRQILKEEIGETSPTLAYPAGGVSENVVATLAEEKFALAFSTQRGVNDQCFQQPLRLNRVNVGGRTTLGLLRSQLANWGR